MSAQTSKMYQSFQNESLTCIKKKLDLELMRMDKKYLQTYFNWQRRCPKDLDQKDAALERLALIDRIYNNDLPLTDEPVVSFSPAKTEQEESDEGSASEAEDARPPSPPRVIKDYTIIKTIGQGTFAKVKLAEHNVTKQKFAIKIIEKRSLKLSKQIVSLKREMHLMKFLRHPHIVRCFDVIETEEEYFIIMEYAANGELFDYIVNLGKLSEEEGRKMFRQLISAMDYCHMNSVIHRDLKPENLLLDENNNIKIIDFGFGNTFHREQLLSTYCGSPYYAAPEMIKGVQYIGPEVDIWSMGVILYAILTGHLPFDGKDLTQLYERIYVGKYKQPDVSLPAQELIQRMLTTNPDKRVTMNEIKNNPWVLKGYHGPPNNFLPRRPAIVRRPNPQSLAVLKTVGFSPEEVTRLLQTDTGLHPVTALYHLAEEVSLTIPEPEDQPQKIVEQEIKEAIDGIQHLQFEKDEGQSLPQRQKSSKRFFIFNLDNKGKTGNKSVQINQKPTHIGAEKGLSSMDIDDILAVESSQSSSQLTRDQSASQNLKSKGFFNVTTTSAKPLDQLLAELEKVLASNHVSFQKKSENCYIAQRNKHKNFHSFEIHILPVENSGHSIHFKRVKGSLWYHKKLSGKLIQDMVL